jgi:hypothetical protein
MVPGKVMEAKTYHWGCENCRTRPIWRAKDTLKLVNARFDPCEVCDARLTAHQVTPLPIGPPIQALWLVLVGLGLMGWGTIKLLANITPTPAPVIEVVKEELTPDGEIPHVHPGDRMTSGQFNRMADKVNELVKKTESR